MDAHRDAVQRVAGLVDRTKIGTLTTMTGPGNRGNRPIAMQEVTYDGDARFFASDHSDLVAQVQANSQEVSLKDDHS